MALTGRYRYRKTLMGNICLQLEHDHMIPWPLPRRGEHRQTWRNATMADLLKPEIRGILEVREFIQQFPEANYGGLRAPLMRIFGDGHVQKPRMVASETDKSAISSA